MPKAVDDCVSSLLSKWSNDPSSRPQPKEKGQDAKSQAFAICTAMVNKHTAEALAIMFEDGKGPTFMGAAATNNPYIPKLKPTKMTGEEGEERFLVHLANSGRFNHPLSGPFVLNRQVFLSFIQNFEDGVIGQEAAYNCKHRQSEGAYGWFEKLMLGGEIDEGAKEFWGLVKPTPVGLERVKGGEFKYNSMEFYLNYDRSDVVLDLEDATSDFCVITDVEGNMSVSLEELQKAQGELEALKKGKLELEQKKLELEQAAKSAKDAEEQAKKEATDAQGALVALEQAEIERGVKEVVDLATSRKDENGNGLPRQVAEWVAGFLKFEIGEGDEAIKLSGDVKVGVEIRRYITAAVKRLILEMPGYVPADRLSSGGIDDPPEDSFEFKKLWED